jgi:hypothetical protein
VLTGGAGDDMLIGGAGGDTLIGGAGTADTVSYAGSAAVTLDLSAATGTGSTGDAAGDTLNGIEYVVGSSNGDSFTVSQSQGWHVDGGAGNDTVTLANNSGSVTEADLLSFLTNVETIDFGGTNVQGNLTMDASTIQSLVGAGNSSHLIINLDGDDSLAISGAAFYTQVGSDYTFYSDGSHTTQIGQLTVT